MKILSGQKEKNKLTLVAGICLVTAFCFMLFFYAPLELYFYNQSDFWFDIYELLPLGIGMFLMGTLLMSLLMLGIYLLFPRLYRLVLPVCVIVYLCTYVQGNYLVNYLPVMEGNYINWDAYRIGRLHTVILWIVVTVIICVAYKLLKVEKFAKVVTGVSGGMSLMLLLTLIMIVFMTDGYKAKMDAYATVRGEYDFSENKNFVILLLDAVDAATTSKLLEQNAEYREIFEDFTYYENALGAYPLTRCAIPHILSGNLYENGMAFEDYVADVYKNSELFAKLEDNGYKLGMYDYDTFYVDDSVYRFENVLHQKNSVKSYIQFAKLEIKLVGFRYAPFDLKRFCMIWSDSFPSLMETDAEYPTFEASNLEFYERVGNSEINIVDCNCFKFIHVEGAHAPFRYDKYMNVDVNGRGTYSENIESALTLTKAYLEKMKAAGIYDNSVIIVMADHGLDGDDDVSCKGRQNPILFVKGLGEKHEMQVSSAPISYVDLQGAFSRLLDGKSSTEIFDWQEGDIRERRYIYYEYEVNDYMYEYVTMGHASEDDQLRATGVEYIYGEN